MRWVSRPHRVALGAVALALGIVVTPSANQAGPSAVAPQNLGTGLIVGQVLDGTTGEPVPEAIVFASMVNEARNESTPKGRVMADASGRYFFGDLPAGEYYLQATKEGYVQGLYGQRQASGPSERLPLGEGQKRVDVRLNLWKYAVLGGTVVDEVGEPVVGVAVRALVRDVVAGRTKFGTASWLVPSAITDDRGIFRLPQVLPGTYVVVAPTTQTTVPAAVLESPDPALRNILFRGGVQEASLLGQPRSQQFDDVALMTLSSVLIPPPPSPTGGMTMYRTTYFPGSVTAADATPVTLRAGDERTDLAISLRPSPAVRVSGRLVAPDGSAPPPMMIRLVGEAMADVVVPSLPNGPADVGFETATALSDARGQFTLLGVPPGTYVISQANRFLSTEAMAGRAAYWCSQRLVVGTRDVSDVVVDLRSGFRVSGRFELEAPTGSQPNPPLILAVTFETPSGAPDQFADQASPQTRMFATVAAGGSYIARPVELGDWYVRSVTVDGKDATDKVFDLHSDVTVAVTLTNRPTRVSGTVRDSRGGGTVPMAVLAFPTDPEAWLDYGASPRNLKKTPTTRSGIYAFDHLPAGDYYVVAIDESDSVGWQDPSRLASFVSQATRVTIAPNESAKTVDLSMRAGR